MIVLAGGDLVLGDRVMAQGSLVIEGDRIVTIDPRPAIAPAGARVIDASGTTIVPGFIDVHVHGVAGIDTLDAGDPVAAIAAHLPRYGVTAFCPTTVACDHHALRTFLAHVEKGRERPPVRSARILPAHLESNFINPDYCGAQPVACLRTPLGPATGEEASGFSAKEVVSAIAASRAQVGIVTLAPELPGGLDLVRDLVTAGHRVSLGHSGADFETAMAAIDAGARHATHLFNRMTPMTHRKPGLPGAILTRDEIAAELICDGHHVHPVMCELALRAKGTRGMMAITDATAGAALPVGSTTRLGGRTIHVTESAAVLDDGTLAGSTLTMDRAFRNVVRLFHRSIVDAANVCATTAARELQLDGLGVLAEGAIADLAVLDRDFTVAHTIIGGEIVYSRESLSA
jgi:N-acetylglucosamine-6-phosphate deacetylase